MTSGSVSAAFFAFVLGGAPGDVGDLPPMKARRSRFGRSSVGEKIDSCVLM